MSFYSLKDLIPKTAGKYQLRGELKAAMVINRASALIKEIFSEEVERCIRVKKLKDGVLWLSATNSAVSEEVLYSSQQLKSRLNESFGEVIVAQVRCVQETEVSEFEI